MTPQGCNQSNPECRKFYTFFLLSTNKIGIVLFSWQKALGEMSFFLKHGIKKNLGTAGAGRG